MSASATDTRVRAATHEDLPAIVAAIGDLLTELSSRPPRSSEMLQTAQALLEEPRSGALLLAEADAENGVVVVGVLTASYQLALHVPGRYALIQDLWVHSSWRGRSVGRALLAALFEAPRPRARDGARRGRAAT